MNYIWDILLQADKQGIPRELVKFVQAEICSPYMEISLEDINLTMLPEDNLVEVNQYYRFYTIFKDLCNINVEESKELREVLLDVLLHYLGEIDLKQGMCKIEFNKKFIYRDIKNGALGESLSVNIDSLEKEELDYFLTHLIYLYGTGVSLQLFKKVLKKVFKNSIVYISHDKPKDIYIYLGEAKSSRLNMKIAAIIETFLPINIELFLFWDKHFGILDLKNTMIIDDIVLTE